MGLAVARAEALLRQRGNISSLTGAKKTPDAASDGCGRRSSSRSLEILTESPNNCGA